MLNVETGSWELVILSYAFVCHHPSVSLNKEKVSREISETKIAVCEKTQSLRSGNFSDFNSACSTVLVTVKIFQFQDMHYENRFLGTFQGHSKRPNIIIHQKRIPKKSVVGCTNDAIYRKVLLEKFSYP